MTNEENLYRGTLLKYLKRPGLMYTVELRPPSSGLGQMDAMTSWIDLNHSIRVLTGRDTFVFFTDDAIGLAEEENLVHISSNLGTDVSASKIVPILTCNHTLEHSLMYVDRLKAQGFEALTVLGGDSLPDTPRCFPHAFMLRKRIRSRYPDLALGGWMNPHREVSQQVGYLSDDDFCADYYLTQIVSHHSLDRVEAFLEECARQGVEIPGIFGVFYYWGDNPKTLETLNQFFPVPISELKREFATGVGPEEILAKTILGLKSLGIEKVYLSNLGKRQVSHRFDETMLAIESLQGEGD